MADIPSLCNWKSIQRQVILISFIGKSVAELYVPVPAKEKVLAVVQEAGCWIENFNPMEQDPKGNTACQHLLFIDNSHTAKFQQLLLPLRVPFFVIE
jgi:hypothetical protein